MRLSVSEARATLSEVLDRVANGDEVTITRHGQPVAVLVRPDALRTRRAEGTIRQARQVADLLAAAGQQSLAPAGLSAQRADELIQAVRNARDRSSWTPSMPMSSSMRP
ncbi:MAG: type II toxin-antitoxin system Phd/YefM family antitoxin [Pseudonocardiaceae bacterium]